MGSVLNVQFHDIIITKAPLNVEYKISLFQQFSTNRMIRKIFKHFMEHFIENHYCVWEEEEECSSGNRFYFIIRLYGVSVKRYNNKEVIIFIASGNSFLNITIMIDVF